jgi:hypothetical protein
VTLKEEQEVQERVIVQTAIQEQIEAAIEGAEISYTEPVEEPKEEIETRIKLAVESAPAAKEKSVMDEKQMTDRSAKEAAKVRKTRDERLKAKHELVPASMFK